MGSDRPAPLVGMQTHTHLAGQPGEAPVRCVSPTWNFLSPEPVPAPEQRRKLSQEES